MADSMCGDDDAHAAMLSAFKQLVADDVAVPVAAMNCLVMTIQRSSASTWMELESEMKASISALMKDCKNDDLRGRTNLSLASGCELFMMYVTRAFSVLHSSAEFSKCRDELVRRGEAFASMSNAARSRIASFGEVFVQENSTVLIHGYSRVVMSILLRAAKTKAFNVVLPEGRPNCEET
jgi:translation initiation factor eIF-2B subunit alpha